MTWKKEPCKLCEEKTGTRFNINFKAVPICEECARSIFIQQAQWYFSLNKKGK